MTLRLTSLASILLVSILAAPTLAEPIPVKHVQGATRGFLVIRSEAGSQIGWGEWSQLATGDRVTARLTLHFRDGSLDDETAVFTQREIFQFVSDHHIQHGPMFKSALDARLEPNGQFTLRTVDKDGKPKVETNRIDLPPDVSNGMIETLMVNIPSQAAPFTLGMVAPSGKGRLIKLRVEPAGTGSFSAVAGSRRTAALFRLKIELGGVAGVVAPVIGKQPSDMTIWILEGDIPILVREVGQLSDGGPVVSLELAGTSFAHSPATK